MTDLRDQLGEAFQSTAASADVPPLPLQDVLARGRDLQRVRRRRRAIWTATAAAVAVAAVTVPLAVVPHDGHGPDQPAPAHQTSPRSIAALPRSTEGAAIASIRDGTLSVNGQVVAEDVTRVVQSGTTILASRGTSPLSITQVGTNGITTPIPALTDAHGDGLGGPVLSPDGTIAVGASQDPNGATLTEWSITAGRVVGTLRIPHASVETVQLDAVDDQGRAYATTRAPQSGFTWQPHGDRTPMTGTLADLWSAGFHAVGPHGPVDPPACADQPLAVAPDGSEVLCATTARSGPGGFVVAPAAGGLAVAVRLPSVDATVVGFDSNASVLLTTRSGGTTWLVRCAVTDGSCERVQTVPAGTTFPRVVMGAAGPMTKPPPTPGSVSLAPPTVPYVENGVLRVKGASIGTGLGGVEAAADTVLAIHTTTPDPNANGAITTSVSLLDGGRLVPVPALTSLGLSNHEQGYAPVLSADGKVAVAMSWLPDSPNKLRMTAWSVSQRRVLGTVDLADDEPTAEDIAGVEDDGTVVYWDPPRQHGYAWSPGHAPQQLDATTSEALEHGAVVIGATGPVVIENLPRHVAGLSPDGSKALTVSGGVTSVADLSSGIVLPLELPEPVYGIVGFESAKTVLLTVGDKQRGPLVRCSTANGACAQVWPSTKGISLPRLLGGGY